jgi:hypothetical protein
MAKFLIEFPAEVEIPSVMERLVLISSTTPSGSLAEGDSEVSFSTRAAARVAADLGRG